MKLHSIALVTTLLFTSLAGASVCDSLFTYEDGQAINEVDKKKARVISTFKLTADSNAQGVLQKQVMTVLGEYGNSNFRDAVLDTDDNEILVTVAQNKKTKKMYTIVQAFLGDTETGKVFSFYSSRELAELGDGECSE